MTRCPKCGGTRIIGPRYYRNVFGGEALRYTCGRCGYSQDGPTNDCKPIIPDTSRFIRKTEES